MYCFLSNQPESTANTFRFFFLVCRVYHLFIFNVFLGFDIYFDFVFPNFVIDGCCYGNNPECFLDVFF